MDQIHIVIQGRNYDTAELLMLQYQLEILMRNMVNNSMLLDATIALAAKANRFPPLALVPDATT